MRSGLKVRFERSPSPDLFSDDEHVVPGRGFSTPTDQSPERVVGPSEEFVESGCPEVVVMEDIGEDLTPKSSETTGEGDDLCVVVGQVRPQTSYSVPLRIQGSPIEAVVDTGAEVSVLGKMFYDQLEQNPPVKRQVTLLQAGHGARLKGFVAGPFDFRVGRHTHRVDLYVAPLKDQMLLGMDIMRDHGAQLDLRHGVLILGGEMIQMAYGRGNARTEARVTLVRKVQVPAGSAVMCPFRLDRGLSDYLVIPKIEDLSDALLMPHTYHEAGEAS